MKEQVALKTQNVPDKSISAKIYKLFTQYRNLTLFCIVAVYILIFSILYPEIFPTFYNFSAVMLAMSIEVTIVIGMAILLIAGEIDLSVGFNMAMAGIICAHLIVYEGFSVALAITVTLLIGALAGFLNGILVAKVGVNSFITTLAFGMVYQGVALTLSKGSTITHLPEEFNVLGQKMLLKIQMPVWYSLVLVIIFVYLMSRTKVFRQFYYTGTNRKAALLSGINVRKMKIAAFMISSILACIAGIVSAARFGNAAALAGQGMELKAITAAVIGGVSFTGGVGTVLGAVLGSLFMALINNALIIAEVNQYWQQIIVGLIMLMAVIVDAVLSRKRV